MTPAEIRHIVERVVAEHGQGWATKPWYGFTCAFLADGLSVIARVSIEHGEKLGSVIVVPAIPHASGDEGCARAVALWPEMQRLVGMLREALR